MNIKPTRSMSVPPPMMNEETKQSEQKLIQKQSGYGGTYVFGTYKNIWIIINTKNTHKYSTKPFAIDILDGYVLVAGNPAVYVLFYIVIMEVYGNFLVYFHDK